MTNNTLDIHAPQFPESIDSGEIVAWNKQVGESFERDEVLAEIETDKVVMEVPAQESGTLLKIKKNTGSSVNSHEVIAVIRVGTAPQKTVPSETEKQTAEHSVKISPSARTLAEEHGLDITAIKTTGKHNSITKQDVQSFVAQQNSTTSTPSMPPARQSIAKTSNSGTQTVPMTRLRRTVAQRLLNVQQSRAVLTTFNEVNVQAITALRKQYQDAFIEKHGVKLGFISFFVQASCAALQKYPIINAASTEQDIIYHDSQDIGIAVSTERGLVVPVLRDAGTTSLADIEKAIVDFANRARHNKLELEELQGGTFTITNGGVFGSMLSTPIINPPQSAILGMHSIQSRPIAEDNNVVIRPMMYLALSYDHRIIDGREAVLFLRDIKETLENPGKLLLDL